MAEEKLVRLSDVEIYMLQTAKNMIDAAEMYAETLTDGERKQIGACVRAFRVLANNVHRLHTVDAEPVVRCKDCVNSYHNGREGTRTCRKFRRMVGVNSYCSCGIAAEELEGTECD